MADEVQDIATTADAATSEAKPKVAARPARAKKQVPRGNIYVHASYNNTMITATDSKGDTLAWATAGSCGFKGPRKATPYAASIVVRDLMKKLEGTGFNEAKVYVSGVGSGREGAIRALNANGVFVSEIKDVTPIPHNGCRPPKPRRI